MSVEVSLNTPLADALSNVVQPKLTEIGWNTGGLDDSALGEYIILMLVNGKTQDQIAAELSNDLLSLGPEDTGATDFAQWLFEQVHVINAQLNGSVTDQTPQVSQGPSVTSFQADARPSHGENGHLGASNLPDADMNEVMEDAQDGSILMGQLSKAMDRSGDAMLHRVRPQQGTERINMHGRQPPKGPRNDQNRNQRMPPNMRPIGVPNGGVPNSGIAAPLMNASPQQQMALLSMLEEQARMMSQIFSPQQQTFMQGMPQPAINPNFRPGGQMHPQQPDRSLFDRVERHPQRASGNFSKRSQNRHNGFSSQSAGAASEATPDGANNDVTSSMEVESSQKSQAEPPSDSICKFNLKCTKQDCPFAHQSPAAPPGITMDLSGSCPFGARCQNRKCIMRHPSPAQNPTQSTVEDCRFFPNCTNPSCPFRHPTSQVPVCRFGENCTREGCKFKHVSITCKFNPCLNPACPYKHADGQKKAKSGDNVWKAGGDLEREHVSERKFVSDSTAEELVVPDNVPAQPSEPSHHGVERIKVRAHRQLVRRFSFSTTRVESDPHQENTNVAVLGGGITGLASAYFLSQQLPQCRITLYEGGSRLGGWLRSQQVDVSNGKVVFEQGPRTLRPTKPNGWITLDLVRDLRMEDQVLMTSKESVAAQNRYIYFPDHLVRLPGPGSSLGRNLYTMFFEPLFKGMAFASLTEIARPAKSSADDESIGSFISRRWSPALADNVASAVIHGIYAGDIYQLSVRSIFPFLWYAEETKKSVTAAMIGGWSLRWPLDAALDSERAKAPPVSDTVRAIRNSSVFTFKRGVGQLAERLEAKLRTSPNVDIRLNTMVEQLEQNRTDNTPEINLVSCSSRSHPDQQKTETFSHVISTVTGKALEGITKPVNSLSMLSQTPSVTVMVVNMYFSNPSILPTRGFGYLLPRSLPFEQNPERALGVVFDSDATIGQDEVAGTKVTVMLGGHWWDGWEAYPDEEQGASMAKDILRRHLRILEDPQAIHVGLQKDCIPQYTVGHYARMARAHGALKRFGGRLRVAGNSYSGVGLNDCVRSARDVVMGLMDDRNQGTGLEGFDHENRPVLWQKKA
ncbi:MAG: hypothetical protein Q9220_007469 [cf. Caloplaca sp. 1 TL-2023]